jgi:hypothetical protein
MFQQSSARSAKIEMALYDGTQDTLAEVQTERQ